jgi:hypothetical protein
MANVEGEASELIALSRGVAAVFIAELEGVIKFPHHLVHHKESSSILPVSC